MAGALGGFLLAWLMSQSQLCGALLRDAGGGTEEALAQDIEQSEEDIPAGLKVMHVLTSGPYKAAFYAPKGKLRPVILYLHGANERHAGIASLWAAGATGTPPVELETKRAPRIINEEFAVIAPHSPEPWNPEKLHGFLDYLSLTGLSLDMTRVIVTGHGEGGSAALEAAALEPHRFAAVVPIACCFRGTDVTMRHLANVPVWVFHGKNDIMSPSSCSQKLVSVLQALGNPSAKGTILESAPSPVGQPSLVGHGSQIPAYGNQQLYYWMLQHRISPEQARARFPRPAPVVAVRMARAVSAAAAEAVASKAEAAGTAGAGKAETNGTVSVASKAEANGTASKAEAEGTAGAGKAETDGTVAVASKTEADGTASKAEAAGTAGAGKAETNGTVAAEAATTAKADAEPKISVVHRSSAGPYEFLWSSVPRVEPKPLILFLHGDDDRKTEAQGQSSENGAPAPIMELAQLKGPYLLRNEFAVVAPHTTEEWDIEKLNKFLDVLISGKANVQVDPNKIYITGSGSGGIAALAMAKQKPHRFAAVVPVEACLTGDEQSLVSIPVWAFHRSDTVAGKCAEDMIASLRSAGASSEMARLTLAENVAGEAYNTKYLDEWLLSQFLDMP